MASLFEDGPYRDCRILDPGAGLGALSSAVLDRWIAGELEFKSVELIACELDSQLHTYLREGLEKYSRLAQFEFKLLPGDFIEHATTLFNPALGRFSHIVLNPPYKKIPSNSVHRSMLRQAGIETVNLYSAFLALSISLAAPGGQIVAIVPRSFCNGPYYQPFREFLLARTSIKRMHLFSSRNKAFKLDEVLQENIIVQLECGGRQSDICISTSEDDTFDDIRSHWFPASQIVYANDRQRFIHVPTTGVLNGVESSLAIRHTLVDIGVQVSTGPVVDFRLREYTRQMPAADTVPLLYPGHLTRGNTDWPRADFKRPNAIVRNSHTEKWLYPNGNYCVVRRFSAKEELRRLVAATVSPESFPGATMLGFENHLNVFHEGRQGMSIELANGLCTYLKMTAVDDQFRRFNGHTQVNATDLKVMKYPSRRALMNLGEWAIQNKLMTQQMIDGRLELLEV